MYLRYPGPAGATLPYPRAPRRRRWCPKVFLAATFIFHCSLQALPVKRLPTRISQLINQIHLRSEEHPKALVLGNLAAVRRVRAWQQRRNPRDSSAHPVHSYSLTAYKVIKWEDHVGA